MLKKLRFLVFAGVLLICSIPLAAGAYSTVVSTNVDPLFPNEYVSPYAGVITEDFEGGTLNSVGGGLPWGWVGNGWVLNGAISGVAAPPMGALGVLDASNYYSVPQNVTTTPQSVLVTIDPLNPAPLTHEHYNYFGLWWGSIDSYNTLTWYNDGVVVAVATVVGNDVAFPPVLGPGNQTLPATNLYLNFLGLPLYDSFGIQSTSYAMELDNVAIGVVPEPATMLLLGLGLLGVAAIKRKF